MGKSSIIILVNTSQFAPTVDADGKNVVKKVQDNLHAEIKKTISDFVKGKDVENLIRNTISGYLKSIYGEDVDINEIGKVSVRVKERRK